jgi:hypothetical protein
MHTADFQTFSGKLVIEVKVPGLLVIAVDFILFSDEKGLFVIYAVYISLQQGGESLAASTTSTPSTRYTAAICIRPSKRRG